MSIQGIDNLTTITGTFQLSDPSLATITQVSGGAILPQFNPDNNSFSFVANGSNGVDLSGSIDLLFFLHLDANTSLGSATIDLAEAPVSFELSGLQSNVPVLIEASVLPGSLEVAANVLGNISSSALDLGGSTVRRVSYQLSEEDGGYVIDLPVNGEGMASTVTGLSMGRMYYVEPVKTSDYRNGISSFEIFLAQRYLLGFDVPQITSPLQAVALDVNCSQSFTNLDLFLLQRLLVDDLDEVPGCNSWTFVPDNHAFRSDWPTSGVFPAPRRAEIMLASDTMVMFTAVKTGDLLGDANPQRSVGELPLRFDLPARMVPGQVYELPVRAESAVDLVSFQSTLRLAPELEFVSITGTGFTDLKANERLAERGELRLSWFNTSGKALSTTADEELFRLTVRVRQAIGSGSELLSFGEQAGYASEAHDGRYNLLTPTVAPTAATAGELLTVVDLVPNPATDYFDLRFTLPETERVEMTLFDGLGKQVVRREQTMAAGANQFQIDVRSLPAGVYHYRLGASGQTHAGKVIVRR